MKNSLITIIIGRGLNNWDGVKVEISKVDILSLIILSILMKPILSRFINNSFKSRTRRFPKWSIWSGFAPGVLLSRIISLITAFTSSNFKTLSSTEMVDVACPLISGRRCHIRHLPTFDKSYLSKLKNIFSINSRAVSAVTKSPGLSRP